MNSIRENGDHEVYDWRIRQMMHLLGEATEHAIAADPHCKSSEGAISLQYPAYPWREEGWPDTIPEPEVEIYSYVLTPAGRLHNFKTIDEALAEVRRWHEEEMNR